MVLGRYNCLYEDYRTEPVARFQKDLFIAFLGAYSRHTPNDFLKRALKRGVLPYVLEQGEQYAYLADYEALFTQALTLFKTDDKHAFVDFLDKHRVVIEKFPPFGLLEDACKHKAVGCATVLLQAGFNLDLNNAFESSHFYPLDYGALHLSLPLTELLLHNGANAGIVTLYGFPLMIALVQLCSGEYVDQWADDDSIFKLLYILCLPQLKEPLAVIKLLASHMDMKQLERVYSYYIAGHDNRHICKLTVLLMAAKDQLLVPSVEGGGLETTAVGEYILKNLRPESERESSGSVVDLKSTSTNHSAKPDSGVFEKAYYVVNIMWKAVDILDRYRNSDKIENVPHNQVPFDIAHDLVNDAELTLNPDDVYCNDIECLRPSNPSKAKALSKRICSKKRLCSTTSQGPLVGKPATGVPLYSSLASFHCRSYHTCRAKNAENLNEHTMGIGMPLVFLSMSHFSQLTSHTKFGVIKLNGMHRSKNLLMKPLSYLNVCASLVSIAKRSIK